jgi:hypothetical protein
MEKPDILATRLSNLDPKRKPARHRHLILEPLPHKCGVPLQTESRIYAAAALQNLTMRIAVTGASERRAAVLSPER